MKKDYTFCKSGKMDGYGMGVEYERDFTRKDRSGLVLLVGVLLAIGVILLAVYLYSAGITVQL